MSKAKLNRSKLPVTSRLAMFFVRHVQHAMSSMGELWRNPLSSFMTMAVLGVSLSLPAALYVMVKNADTITQKWDSAAQISLFIDNSMSNQGLRSMVARISVYPEVAKVNYITRDQALVEFQSQSGFGEALSYLDKNPLPSVVTVTPVDRYSTPEGARLLLQKLQLEPGVSYGRLDIEWLERLHSVMALLEHIASAIAALLVFAVILVIGNTIRLAILNQRQEIEVMKLVGATERFIRRPFLYAGIWYGIIGGGIAWLIVNILIWYLQSAFTDLLGLYGSHLELVSLNIDELFELIIMASLLGWLGAYISVWRHLRAIEPA